MRALEEQAIEPFDLVCVNLYPFEARRRRTRRRGGAGGRADRHRRPRDAAGRGEELRALRARLPAGGLRARARGAARLRASSRRDTRRALRRRVPSRRRPRTRRRSRAGSPSARPFPDTLTISFDKVLDLEYGENPHQRAAYYGERGARSQLLSRVEQLHGKPLTFNNLNDLSAGWLLLRRVPAPGVRDREACEPVRGGSRSDDRRGVREGAPADPIPHTAASSSSTGPVSAVARHLARRAVHRGAVRAGIRRAGDGGART